MPKTINSLWGAFVVLFALGLLILKLWIHIPLPSFAVFGLAFLGAGLSLTTRFRLHQKSPWDFVAWTIGGAALIWSALELLFPH